MEKKPIRPEAKAIQERFFNALDVIIEQRKVTGLKPFCIEYNLNQPKYSRLRSQTRDPKRTTTYTLIDIHVLYYLVRDFKVSADWLLTGRGTMFK